MKTNKGMCLQQIIKIGGEKFQLTRMSCSLEKKIRIREKRKIKNERTYMAFYNVINGGAADDFRM